MVGIRIELNQAETDVERRGLKRVLGWTIALVIAVTAMFSMGALLMADGWFIAGYASLCAGLGTLYLWRVPRIVRPRWERAIARDPTLATAWRRELTIRWVGFVVGVALGGFALVVGLSP